jgi:hypothetical protein
MRVYVDGKSREDRIVSQKVSSRVYKNYAYQVDVPAGVHDVYVAAEQQMGGGQKIFVDSVAFGGPDSTSPAASGCARHAAPAGSDANAGTYEHPYRTAEKLTDSLSAGESGCLRGGSYSEADNTWNIHTGGTAEARITVMSASDERATFNGRVVLGEGADYWTFKDLKLDSTAGPRNADGYTLPSPTVNGSYSVWINNEITNDHTGICKSLTTNDAEDNQHPLVERNKIHDFGVLPRTNHHHGIYASHVDSAIIRDNWIYDNADRGISLYPDSDDAQIYGNIIAGNGVGVQFSGSGSSLSEGNDVHNNVIANSQQRWNIQTSFTQTNGVVGQGNVASHNCVWATNPNRYYNRKGGITAGCRVDDPSDIMGG